MSKDEIETKVGIKADPEKIGGATEKNVEVKKPDRKKEKKSYEAILNIYTSFNNTIVHVTDMSGRANFKGIRGGGSKKR